MGRPTTVEPSEDNQEEPMSKTYRADSDSYDQGTHIHMLRQRARAYDPKAKVHKARANNKAKAIKQSFKDY